MKKVVSIVLSLLIVLISFPVPVHAAKYNVWANVNKASEYEISGEIEKALPLWIKIVDYFEKIETEDAYTNLAIFHKKIAKYYDSVKNYDKAVYHYEKENEYWLKVGKNWGAEDMIRADQIRTVFEFYTKVKSDSINNLAKYEPKNGFYVGIYSENDKKIGQNLYKTEEVYGPHQIFLFYQNWNQRFNYDHEFGVPLDTKMAKRAKKENAAIQIALNAMDGLDSVEENKWIIEWAKEAKKLDMPIFLRFLGEMNGDWVPWSGEPEKYKEKFILVHDIMEKYAPNVAMVWCPNDVPVELNGYRIEDYYPGDEYVDWVGVNFYVDYYNSGRTDLPNNRFQNPLDHLNYIYNKFSDRKPIMICETGVSHYSIPNNEDLTDWAVENLKKLYTMLPIKYPRIKAINYFSLNQNNPNYHVGNRWNNYAISENKKVEAAYKKLIKSSSIVKEIGGSVDFTYKKINNYEEIKNYKEIYPFVKIGDYKVSKIEVFVDDKLVDVLTDLPFVIKYDFKNVKKLTLKVYDSNNNLYTVKEILFSSNEEQTKLKLLNISGNVLKTDIITEINGKLIESYNIDNNTAIIINDLSYYGYDVSYDNNTRILTLKYNKNKPVTGKAVKIKKVSPEEVGKIVGKYVSTDIKVIVDGIELSGLNINGYMVVDVKELKKVGCSVNWNGEERKVEITLP